MNHLFWILRVEVVPQLALVVAPHNEFDGAT